MRDLWSDSYSCAHLVRNTAQRGAGKFRHVGAKSLQHSRVMASL